VLREAKEVEAASEKLRLEALKGSKDGKDFDNREGFLKLRNEWFDAAKLKAGERKDKQAEIMSRVGDALGPWTAKVDEHLAATRKRIVDAGYQPDELPDGAQLAAAIAKAKAVWKKLRDAAAALKEKKPRKGAAASAKQAIKQARLLLADLAGPEAALDADAAVLAEVERLAQLADARYGALGSKAWLDRVEIAKQGMLHDPKLIFGSTREKVVGDPGMAQLVDTGFFRTRNNSDYAGAFSPEFVQTMVKYGFTPLASGSEPDSMHFELRKGKPA
jgi:hypothetical protein